MRRRYRRKRKKFVIIQIIILILISIGLGYSYLSSNLSMQGSSFLNFTTSEYKYAINTIEQELGQPKASGINFRSTPQEAMQDWVTLTGESKPYYLKYKIENNIVTEAYIEFIISNTVASQNPGLVAGTYSLRLGDDYEEENANILMSAFSYPEHPENLAISPLHDTALYSSDITIISPGGGGQKMVTKSLALVNPCILDEVNNAAYCQITESPTDTLMNFTVTSQFINISSPIPSGVNVRNKPSQVLSDWQYLSDESHPFYIQHDINISDNTVDNNKLFFVVTNAIASQNEGMYPATYYMDYGPDNSSMNEEFLKFIFDYQNHPERCDINTEEDYIRCDVEGLTVGVDASGTLLAAKSDGIGYCMIDSNGSSHCVDRIYTVSDTTITIFGQLPDTVIPRLSKEEAMSDWTGISSEEKPFYLKHRLMPFYSIAETYLEFVVTEDMVTNNPGMIADTYSLKYDNETGEAYTENINKVKTAFGFSTHPERCEGYGTIFFCQIDNLALIITDLDGIMVQDKIDSYCEVGYNRAGAGRCSTS